MSKSAPLGTALVVVFGFSFVMSIISSYPSSYTFEFVSSQFNGCRVNIESPFVRTGLGLLGGYGGGIGWWGGALAKAVELTNPRTAEVFHGPVCK